jgi:hypothetical protein
LGPTPKFEIPLPTLFSPGHKVSKKACHTPVGHKLREEIDLLETGHFWPRAINFGPADLILPPKNYLLGVGLVLKISSKSFHSIKSYNFLIQTDRQTHEPPSLYRRAKFFLCLFLIPFTSLHSLPSLHS